LTGFLGSARPTCRSSLLPPRSVLDPKGKCGPRPATASRATVNPSPRSCLRLGLRQGGSTNVTSRATTTSPGGQPAGDLGPALGKPPPKDRRAIAPLRLRWSAFREMIPRVRGGDLAVGTGVGPLESPEVDDSGFFLVAPGSGSGDSFGLVVVVDELETANCPVACPADFALHLVTTLSGPPARFGLHGSDTPDRLAVDPECHVGAHGLPTRPGPWPQRPGHARYFFAGPPWHSKLVPKLPPVLARSAPPSPQKGAPPPAPSFVLPRPRGLPGLHGPFRAPCPRRSASLRRSPRPLWPDYFSIKESAARVINVGRCCRRP